MTANGWWIATLSLATSACSLLFSGNFDGTTSGGPPNPNDSGGEFVGDGGTSGEVIEGGGKDSGQTGAEAGSGGGYCAGQTVLFCDDFDDGAGIEVAWPMNSLEHGATIEKSTKNAASPPTSALAATPAISDSATQPRGDRLRLMTWAGTKSTIAFGMSIFVDRMPSQRTAIGFFATLDFVADNQKPLQTRLLFQPNDTDPATFSLQQVIYPAVGAAKFLETPISIPRGRWVRIERLSKLDAPPTETITVDGVSNTFALDAAFHPATELKVTLGFQYTNGPGDDYAVYIDNVVVDAH